MFTRPRFALLAVLLLGLAVTLAPARPDNPKPPKPAAKDVPSVPKDVSAFVSVNVAEAWDHKAFGGVREARGKVEFAWAVQSLVGLTPAEMDRLIAFWHPSTPDAPFVLVTARKAVDPAAVVKTLTRYGATGPKPVPGGKILVAPGAEFAYVRPIDARTLLLAPKAADPAAIEKLVGGYLDALLAAGKHHSLTVGVDVKALAGLPLPFGGPLLEAETAVLTADFGEETAAVKLTATFPTAAKAGAAAPILRAKFDEVSGWAKEQQRKAEERPAEANAYPAPLLEWVAATFKAAKVKGDGRTVVASAEVKLEEAVSRVLMAVPDAALAPRGGTAAENNLKQIGLALHNYLSANDHFPGNSYDKDGKPLLSWRVHILPYIEQAAVYQRFKLDEPWDSPNNKPLGELVIRVFQVPGRPAAQPWETYFRTFIGPKGVKGEHRPWLVEGDSKGPKIGLIADGTSNTLMVVEAATAVPWAKPDDLPYDGVLPLPKLGGASGAFVALFGDGSVHTFRRGQIDDKNLRWMISVADGNPVTIPGR